MLTAFDRNFSNGYVCHIKEEEMTAKMAEESGQVFLNDGACQCKGRCPYGYSKQKHQLDMHLVTRVDSLHKGVSFL